MTKLSVNINKIATLRNARGGNLPNVVATALDIERFGADGITVHPRPDARHIRYSDVRDLRQVLSVEFNIEGYPSEDFIKLVLEVKPAQVTLVPDAPDALTSSAGWHIASNKAMLQEVLQTLSREKIRTSLFVECDLANIEEAAKIGADRIELYTEPYARAFESGHHKAEIQPFSLAAAHAHKCGLGVNAGHDLSKENLAFFARHVAPLDEVSIGHALIADALYLGLEETIRRYKNCLIVC